MASEIVAAGYQDVRDYIQANWKYIELRDDLGVAVLRLSPADPRVSWTHTAGAQTLELSIVITGSDAGLVLPQKFASSLVYKVASAGSPLTSVQTFTTFEMASTSDQLTIKHSISVPVVV
ncbi:MAG: hypothetical protein CVU90_01995 [Firmicutes bacterium HGW-Firmicutes-15]|nr:MAG: hypothetical protein CVU90_01995 [Firmicutes bacterium HGW-Firmicutes-15]